MFIRKLKGLKDTLNIGYSDLINIFIETYKRYRLEELERLYKGLRIDEDEAEKIIEIYRQLKSRKWW
jgi:hypothetical protein